MKKYTFSSNIQSKQNDFRMAVTDIKSALVNESPIDPNTKPANKRAKYGRLANTPACAILNPKTFGFKKKELEKGHLCSI